MLILPSLGSGFLSWTAALCLLHSLRTARSSWVIKKKMFDFQSSVPLIPFRPLLNRISGYYIYLLTVHDLLTMPRFSAVLD